MIPPRRPSFVRTRSVSSFSTVALGSSFSHKKNADSGVRPLTFVRRLLLFVHAGRRH